MPRLARVVIPGCPHHLTQRGNRREDVFFTVADRVRYLELLAEYAEKHGLAVQAYCLMTNHVHLVVVPRAEASLAAALKPLHTRYTQHVNRTQGVSGRLWQGRFFSCPLDEEHLWAAVRYVERNPVRAGMVELAEDYRWSSAAAHSGLRTDGVLSDPCELTSRLTADKWRQWLREPWEAEEEMTARLRQCTRTGRPAGGAGFISRLEALVGRVLQAKKVGRPRKQRKPPSETTQHQQHAPK